MAKSRETAFELRIIGEGITPDTVPLRAVSEALSAVQDLATGRDPFETPHVAPEESIGLVEVSKGSAIYGCVPRMPELARENLKRVGALLSHDPKAEDDESIVALLQPIEKLSEIAKKLGCRLEVAWANRRVRPLFSVEGDAYSRLSKRLFVSGESTVSGVVERVGGATGMRCLLRVPGRRKVLYCNVRDRSLARRLGQCLYESVVASGRAKWLHTNWRIVSFTISDFTQPKLGNPKEAVESLRAAGLSAWDEIEDPESFVRELRS